MTSYLQPATESVVESLEPFETVYAKDQQEDGYNPLRVLRSNDRQCACMSRWTFTAEQRLAIATGSDVYLEQWTFNTPLQPVRLSISDGLDPEIVAEIYNLKVLT